MHEIQSSAAKARLPQRLDDVERGETVIITRHGRAIARIVPEASAKEANLKQAIKAIKRLRKNVGPMPLDELLSARHEGHKY